MRNFLDRDHEYVFEGETGTVNKFRAYSLDGALNIADRLFRHEPYILVTIDGLSPGGPHDL